MGVGGEKPSMREIDDTRGSGRDEAFEAILERIKDSGGEITRDETYPLFTDIGTDQFEIGVERAIEFTLNRIEFQLIRRTENYHLSGMGKQKHVEELTPARIKIVLKRKSSQNNEWQVVDLEDMF